METVTALISSFFEKTAHKKLLRLRGIEKELSNSKLTKITGSSKLDSTCLLLAEYLETLTELSEPTAGGLAESVGLNQRYLYNSTL